MPEYPNYEFYVLRHDFNARKVVNFNIFQNWLVAEDTTKHVEKYFKGLLSFNQLQEEIRKTIAWQEHYRVQYEISVGDVCEKDWTKLEKWDCYQQAVPNMKLITKMCIERYKEWRDNNGTQVL